MGKEFRAGVSFADDVAQVAVLEIGRADINVAYVEEFKNGMIGELWYLESLFVKQHKILKKVSKVSIAFDNELLSLHRFPLDSSLNREEVQGHVNWELSNIISGFSPKDFVQDAHILSTHAEDQVAEMFVVSAKRSSLSQIRSMLEKQEYQLEIADANHFGAQYALLVNYPDVKSRNVSLIWIGEKRIDVGVLIGGRLAAYGYAPAASEVEGAEFIQYFLRGYDIGEHYLYGSGPLFEVQKVFEGGIGVPVTRLNPFRRLAVSKSCRDFEMTVGIEHRFASAVGVALRKQ